MIFFCRKIKEESRKEKRKHWREKQKIRERKS